MFRELIEKIQKSKFYKRFIFPIVDFFSLMILLYLLTACSEKKVVNHSSYRELESIKFEDFKLEKFYFSFAQEGVEADKNMVYITRDNLEKCLNNIIILRKAFYEREVKLEMVKELSN